MALYKDSSIRKVNYYDDLLLTEDELNVDQHYHEKMRHMQNALLYGYGIVEGFQVSKEGSVSAASSTITVGKGKALVRNINTYQENQNIQETVSREVILFSDTEIKVADKINVSSEPDSQKSIYITACINEVLDNFQPLKGNDFFHRLQTTDIYLTLESDAPFEVPDGHLFLAEVSADIQSGTIVDVTVTEQGRQYGGLCVQRIECESIAFDTAQPDKYQKIKPLPNISIESHSIDGQSLEDYLVVNARNLRFAPFDTTQGVMNIEGTMLINGDFIINGNLEVKGKGPGSTTEIQSSELRLKDNIIVLDQTEDGTAPESDRAGLEVNVPPDLVMRADPNMPVFTSSAAVSPPSIVFVRDHNNNNENPHWWVSDGARAGKLAINLEPELLDGNIADERHHHSFLYDVKNRPALSCDTAGNIHIGTEPSSSDVQKLNVEGSIGLINQGVVSIGEKKQDSLQSLFYTYVLVPSGTAGDDAGTLQGLIGSNRTIYIARSDYALTLNKTITIPDNTIDLKIVSAEGQFVTIGPAWDEFSDKVLFTITGGCKNIEFHNLKVTNDANFCKVINSRVSQTIDGLLINKCCNYRDDGLIQGSGYLFICEPGLQEGIKIARLNDLVFTHNRWHCNPFMIEENKSQYPHFEIIQLGKKVFDNPEEETDQVNLGRVLVKDNTFTYTGNSVSVNNGPITGALINIYAVLDNHAIGIENNAVLIDNSPGNTNCGFYSVTRKGTGELEGATHISGNRLEVKQNTGLPENCLLMSNNTGNMTISANNVMITGDNQTSMVFLNIIGAQRFSIIDNIISYTQWSSGNPCCTLEACSGYIVSHNIVPDNSIAVLKDDENNPDTKLIDKNVEY